MSKMYPKDPPLLSNGNGITAVSAVRKYQQSVNSLGQSLSDISSFRGQAWLAGTGPAANQREWNPKAQAKPLPARFRLTERKKASSAASCIQMLAHSSLLQCPGTMIGVCYNGVITQCALPVHLPPAPLSAADGSAQQKEHTAGC